MRFLVVLAAIALMAASEISDTTGSDKKFQGANAFCDTLAEDTNTDWRMPTVDELVEQATDGNDEFLWTRSLKNGGNTPRFLLMNLSNGKLADLASDTNAAVRCVR